ncbi:MAG: exodeoxyribonuclease III [Rickettsiaceae bacterium]|nr:exodeoxyribonuclease III [Rickettsiaceae bacterium]
MRIATWNINSVRLRIDSIKKFSQECNPDIILLQETKVENSLFPAEELKNLGFKYLFFEGQKSYNGVAILSKIPFEDKFNLIFSEKDDKRHICVKAYDIEIHNFYIPAGGEIPDINQNPKFKHKLEYLEQMKQWFLTNRSKDRKMIIAGDLNIAPHQHDVWSSRALRNEVSHTDIERSIINDIIRSMDWNDIARSNGNNGKIFSWWSYRNIDWRKTNRGRRLDHIWLSPAIGEQYENFNIFTDSRGWEKASDHVPVIVDLK